MYKNIFDEIREMYKNINTSWISGNINPADKKIYIRHIAGIIRQSKWDGKIWLDLFYKYPTDKKVWMKSYSQNLEWREND